METRKVKVSLVMTIFVNGGLEYFIRFMNQDERIGVLYPA